MIFNRFGVPQGYDVEDAQKMIHLTIADLIARNATLPPVELRALCQVIVNEVMCTFGERLVQLGAKSHFNRKP